MIRLLIADDHGLFRKGIVNILVQSNIIDVVGEAQDGEELIEKYFQLKPDILLADISMPGMSGLEAFEKIFKKDPEAKALFLSMHDEEEYVYKVARAGGMGLINKNYLEEELYTVIEKVSRGETFFPFNITPSEFIDRYERYEQKKAEELSGDIGELTEREKEVFLLVGKGYSSSQIGEALQISDRTVSTHRAHIMDKLNLKTFHALFKLAVEYALKEKK
ncbi:MAG: response regulator [Syntrophothermus sp.]